MPYTVPEGYFDNLHAKIQDRIAAKDSTKKRFIPVALKTQLSFAAGFAFLVVLAYFGFYIAKPISQRSINQGNPNYVEIVSRSISQFDDKDLYNAVENKRKTDSLKRVQQRMQEFYYSRSRNCLSIIEEKKEVRP